MKRFTLLLATVLSFGLTVCAQQQNSNTMNKKILVSYFSASGTTASVARKLASAASATLFEIQPEQPYTDADLNWNNRQSRSSVEMNDPASRPAMKGKVADMAQYDVVFIGFPVWWDLAPRVVNTFIESHDLKGKTVIPFATSGGSTINGSVAALKKAYPEIDWRNGRLLNRADEKTLRNWVEEIKNETR